MNIIIFGPQASGKGTQSQRVAEHYQLKHLSTGDAFRQEIKKGTALGKWIDHTINVLGELIPDDKTNEVIFAHAEYFKTGIVLDGYPRNVAQYEFLKSHFQINAAIEITLPEDEIIARISSRRVCTQCGEGYNLITLKPKIDGECDKCHSPLVQRDDDKPEQIRKRLQIYYSQTTAITPLYHRDGIFYTVDGNKPIPEVASEIFRILDGLNKTT
ncbi:MAG: nucleoside monophosphate kinase [Candidatus Woesearchaeota archaeon]